jgi:hypothetical protein
MLLVEFQNTTRGLPNEESNNKEEKNTNATIQVQPQSTTQRHIIVSTGFHA